MAQRKVIWTLNHEVQGSIPSAAVNSHAHVNARVSLNIVSVQSKSVLYCNCI